VKQVIYILPVIDKIDNKETVLWRGKTKIDIVRRLSCNQSPRFNASKPISPKPEASGSIPGSSGKDIFKKKSGTGISFEATSVLNP